MHFNLRTCSVKTFMLQRSGLFNELLLNYMLIQIDLQLILGIDGNLGLKHCTLGNWFIETFTTLPFLLFFFASSLLLHLLELRTPLIYKHKTNPKRNKSSRE